MIESSLCYIYVTFLTLQNQLMFTLKVLLKNTDRKENKNHPESSQLETTTIIALVYILLCSYQYIYGHMNIY